MMDNNQEQGNGKKVFFIVISIALAIGGFVPALVNLAAAGAFTWALYPLGAVAMTWLILAPLFLFRRQRLLWSWLAAVVTLPLFLWLVETVNPSKGWLLPLALPAAAVGLAAWGALICVWRYSRIRILYAVSLTLLVLALTSFTEKLIVRPFIQPDPLEWVRDLVSACLAGLAALFALLGLAVHRLQFFKEPRKM